MGIGTKILNFSQIRKVEFQCMVRIYIHPALECYSSFYGMEKFIGVPQFSFAFQTVQDSEYRNI
jgi:hypothetical protein